MIKIKGYGQFRITFYLEMAASQLFSNILLAIVRCFFIMTDECTQMSTIHRNLARNFAFFSGSILTFNSNHVMTRQVDHSSANDRFINFLGTRKAHFVSAIQHLQ